MRTPEFETNTRQHLSHAVDVAVVKTVGPCFPLIYIVIVWESLSILSVGGPGSGVYLSVKQE